ncbi:hypothetical protein PJK54_11845 [Cobetia sp. MMG027]|uniref:hypothetical protein n=1 Tax=Cobetia sp. MMG027 TaxID=3021980 RepID=UPI0022FE197A|nr:hypothetical protein [Cobetia sp. MMG027]MDA5564356.1 hypothetical protein [Cobetia sp. MMG027]
MKRLILAAATALCLAPTAHAANGVPDDVAMKMYQDYANCHDMVRLISGDTYRGYVAPGYDLDALQNEVSRRLTHYWNRLPRDKQSVEIPNTAARELFSEAKNPDIVSVDAINGLPSAIEYMESAVERELGACHYLAFNTELLE